MARPLSAVLRLAAVCLLSFGLGSPAGIAMAASTGSSCGCCCSHSSQGSGASTANTTQGVRGRRTSRYRRRVS
jgi:hypothetical protein